METKRARGTKGTSYVVEEDKSCVESEPKWEASEEIREWVCTILN